jgi:hypothetical protein
MPSHHVPALLLQYAIQAMQRTVLRLDEEGSPITPENALQSVQEALQGAAQMAKGLSPKTFDVEHIRGKGNE